ncbi:Dabb family protein [Streptomyces sp. NPDC051569]|uniref:Dabb family protein n=1 Tax=Streptomyces sp. NPDC051569 TaxID=3365661 RepID=UPI0037A81007
MILHTVTFTWKDGVPESSVEALTRELKEMASKLHMLRFYSCGRNLRLRPGGADFAVVSAVDDAESLHAYLDHPAHVAVLRTWTDHMIADRQAVQIEIPHLPGHTTQGIVDDVSDR